ncbi:PLP-dependent aminotransferase family protein [Nocardioides sp. NPDC057767]|uniref:aminotransferase-like domain-containing protein n=1 Tax=unclassified Nocardioides TaxID=2615069 RepID=UPI00366B0CDA
MTDLPQRATSSRLDPYADRYAARTAGMTVSEVRALFAVAARPEVVSLAGGMPNISSLPLDVVGDSIQDLILSQGPTALQYGGGQGDPVLREQICEVMRLEGIEAHPDDVVVTVGSQQAVDLVTRVFCDPGDVVICEAPSYVGALGVFKGYQCDVVHAEVDASGLIPSALEQAIVSTKASGRRVKFLYTIPNFQNPTGVTMTPERRTEILEICRRHDILVLEDNPYGLLGFDDEPRPAMRAQDPGVIYLGSFSKTFSPGLRVGWALAPSAIREKLVLAQESATLCPPPFNQMAVSAYLANHDWQGQIKQMREMYRERRDAMLDALEAYMPAACTWTKPDGGFFVWLTLPAGIDCKAMLPRAVTARVAYVPGTGFFADGFGASSMRISYCYPTPERIREGVRRLAGVIEAEMELLETFGATGPIPGLPIRGAEHPSTNTQ